MLKPIVHYSMLKNRERFGKTITRKKSRSYNKIYCRSVGVSNFGVAHLEALAKLGLEKPSVNQIELHPWQQKRNIVKYCREHDIAVMGYSPLAKGKKIEDETVAEIAKK